MSRRLRLLIETLVLGGLLFLVGVVGDDRMGDVLGWVVILGVAIFVPVYLAGVFVLLRDWVRAVRLNRLTRIWMRRKAANRCLGCGYDLRGGGERCPECGLRVGSWREF